MACVVLAANPHGCPGDNNSLSDLENEASDNFSGDKKSLSDDQNSLAGVIFDV